MSDLALSPDTAILAALDTSGAVTLWDTRSGVQIAAWRMPYERSKWRQVGFLPDGVQLVVIPESGNSFLVDLLSGRVRVGPDITGSVFRSLPAATQHPAKPPDGALDLRDDVELALIRACNRALWQISVSEVARRAAVSLKRAPATVRVIDLDSNELLQQWSLPSCKRMQFLEDGQRLAVATREGEIHVLDVDSGRMLATLRGHTADIECLATLPGQDRLISGSDDRTIRLWDLRTWQEVLDLRGHRDTVTSVVATPDGQTMFSSSGDYTVRRWDARPLAQLAARRDEYLRIAERLQARLDALPDGPNAAAAGLEADRSLTPRERQIALQLQIGRTVLRAD